MSIWINFNLGYILSGATFSIGGKLSASLSGDTEDGQRHKDAGLDIPEGEKTALLLLN